MSDAKNAVSTCPRCGWTDFARYHEGRCDPLLGEAASALQRAVGDVPSTRVPLSLGSGRPGRPGSTEMSAELNFKMGGGKVLVLEVRRDPHARVPALSLSPRSDDLGPIGDPAPEIWRRLYDREEGIRAARIAACWFQCESPAGLEGHLGRLSLADAADLVTTLHGFHARCRERAIERTTTRAFGVRGEVAP